MTPTIPTHPWATNPNGRPDLYPWLFTKRPENGVNIPTYRRPGTGEITARQAIDLVNWLNTLGFRFSPAKYEDSSMEGHMVLAQAGDPTPRIHYSKFGDATPENPDDDNGEVDLARVADMLGGWLSSPTTALAQLGFENGLAPIMFRAVTDQQIVNNLAFIFRPANG